MLRGVLPRFHGNSAACDALNLDRQIKAGTNGARGQLGNRRLRDPDGRGKRFLRDLVFGQVGAEVCHATTYA